MMALPQAILKCCAGLRAPFEGMSPGPALGAATFYLGDDGIGVLVNKTQLLNAGRKSLV